MYCISAGIGCSGHATRRFNNINDKSNVTFTEHSGHLAYDMTWTSYTEQPNAHMKVRIGELLASFPKPCSSYRLYGRFWTQLLFVVLAAM
jgi:hypothetical protein